MPTPLLLAFSLVLSPAQAAPTWPELATAPAGVARDGANDVALVIAIEDYVIPGVPDVAGARENAAAWRAYLKDVRGVPVVKVLTDAAASKEGMLEAAQQVRGRLKPGGRVWLVYIGHGAPSRERTEGLLVGADAQQSASSLYARSLPQSELLRALGAEAGVPVVAVLDACFSGATSGGRLVEGLQPLLPVEAPVSGTATILSAGRAEQFAGPLPGLGRPAFSWLVLGALRGWGDADRDGTVSAREAVDFANDRLVELVNDRTQEPQLSGVDRPLGKGREKAPALDALVETAPVRAPEPAPVAPASGGASGGGDVSADVAALKRLKSMRESREAKLGELARAKAAEGAAAWTQLSGVLGDGSPEELAVVERYVKTWTDARVWVEDAEGRHEKAVTVAAVEDAKAWLGRAGKGSSGRDWTSPTFGTMKWIPAGSFLMGSPASEVGRLDDEGPQHRVTLTKGYWMMEHEVTQGEWQAVMGSNPSFFSACGASCPVERVSWDDAVAFARRASARDGVTYALPTEAQWEYAARGGGAGVYAGGNDAGAVAWTVEYRGGMTHPVCQKARNGYGLCDMSGNVREWTADVKGTYSSGALTDPRGPASGWYRVRRGGGWCDGPQYARVANRDYYGEGQPACLGLRLSRTDP